jgi:hypothetical protein
MWTKLWKTCGKTVQNPWINPLNWLVDNKVGKTAKESQNHKRHVENFLKLCKGTLGVMNNLQAQ